jgi:type III pantothenate kinase
MNLVVDDGNSLTKVGIFDQDRLAEKHTFSDWHSLESLCEKVSPSALIVCSVRDEEETPLERLAARRKFRLSHTLPVPVVNSYQTPQTLGMDRLAGVCGGMQLFPDRNTLIIDAGTCVTFDFVDAQGVYHGGSIGPGLTMRREAVHHFTARLPLVPFEANPPLIGNSTISCIQSGVLNGMVHELSGMIRQYEQQYNDLQVVLCGGDSALFENKLKASIFACPDLVLVGLNSILRYNVNR